jgi:hypothetical protein
MLIPVVVGRLNKLLVKAGILGFSEMANAEAGTPDDSIVMLHHVFCDDVFTVLEYTFPSSVKLSFKYVFPIIPAAAMAESVQGAIHSKTLPESKAEEVVPHGKLVSDTLEILGDEIGDPRVQNVIPVKTEESLEKLSNTVTDDLLGLLKIHESNETEYFAGMS